ncbi:hypothetical protein B0T22DRAFT_288864 [Podospora appendiculata]|uniref:Alpha/beta hydrolase fold-3 domain-containing protein n=1 Tax=Podospora appendiculata TaxID=314037 RepID=A0AAE0X1A4_9PEZI|nr:hypothetical protein B0T22DRAFT_288864 [Podospora appendiculata]
MRGWPPSLRLWRVTLRLQRANRFATPAALSSRSYSSVPLVQRVRVPCASSGEIIVSLHNLANHAPTTPLMIWIPPFPQEPGKEYSHPAALPSWLQHHPAAIINYRWAGQAPNPERPHRSPTPESVISPYWPIPIHDIVFGYSWIVQNLGPPNLARRDIYVHSSYLGASLAAGLALTETHSHQPTAVRGLVAYNGIYNWTAFLPDHPIHKAVREAASKYNTSSGPDTQEEERSLFHDLESRIPSLFRTPADLFDPFASASLFFHSPGLHVPPDFYTSYLPETASSWSFAISALTGENMHPQMTSLEPGTETAATMNLKPPRKGYYAFPPRASTLKIPETLLLHESPPAVEWLPGARRGKRKPAPGKRKGENSFRVQAEELGGLMRRSIEKLELKERMKWDEEFGKDSWESESLKRVRVVDVGRDVDGEGEQKGLGLSGFGREVVGDWLEERGGRTRGR